MAKTFNRNEIYLGDHSGRKQSVVSIPAQTLADKPGVLGFDSVTDGGVRTTYYTWFDSSGNFRYHTSIPTNQDSDGSTITSGANTALSNLASVAINTALLPVTTVGAIDLGSAAKAFRTAYLGTSLVFVGASLNTTLAFTEVGTLGRTYTFPDAGAAANVMLDTGAANVIAYTKGTSTIAFAANSDLVLATGITATFNAACTIGAGAALTTSTEAITLNQSLSTSDAVAFATGSTVGNLTLANGSITDSSGAISFGNENLTTTGTINLASDNINITLGESGSTDSRIFFDGSGNLKFYDSNLGAARSLTELYTGTTLNPSVSGDLTIAEGKFTWTDAVDEAAGVFTFAGTAVADIAISSAITTGKVISITADACANGTLLYLDSDGGPGATGYYINCYNGSAAEFTIGLNGVIVAATTGDSAHKISRNNATGTAPVLEIEETHATGGTTLLIDSNATDGNDALVIEHDGTGSGLKITGTAVTGTQATFIGPASQSTSSVIINGTAGSFIGADNVGMLHLSADGVLAAGSNLLRVAGAGLNAAGSFLVEIEQTGKVVGATDGICLKISETAAATATSYAVSIASTSNEALHVDTGLSLFDERVTITLADNTGPALAITNPDTTGNSNAVTITPSGSGAGLLISPQEADTVGLSIAGPASSTVSQFKIDGSAGAGWLGAANVGMLHLVNDGTYADVAASMLYIGNSGVPVNDSTGHCLRIVDTGNAAAGTMAYPVYISSNDATVGGVYITTAAAGTALNVAAGTANFGGIANFAAGLKTVVAVTDVADPPTQANMVTAFGAAATAGAGFIGFLNDANAGVNNWLCVSNGTDWFYATKLVIGG